jgi:hypothetical protein
MHFPRHVILEDRKKSSTETSEVTEPAATGQHEAVRGSSRQGVSVQHKIIAASWCQGVSVQHKIIAVSWCDGNIVTSNADSSMLTTVDRLVEAKKVTVNAP